MARSLIPWKRRPSALAREEEGHPFELLHRQMNQLFDDFFQDAGRGWMTSPLGRDDLRPDFEIEQGTDAITVTADLPGLEEKDIEVSLDENVLTVSGERSEETRDEKPNRVLSERRYGAFRRSFELPSGLDPDQVRAAFKRGVLTITIPRTPEAKAPSRRIPVTGD